MDARPAAYVGDLMCETSDSSSLCHCLKLLYELRHPPIAFLRWTEGVSTGGTLKCCRAACRGNLKKH